MGKRGVVSKGKRQRARELDVMRDGGVGPDQLDGEMSEGEDAGE